VTEVTSRTTPQDLSCDLSVCPLLLITMPEMWERLEGQFSRGVSQRVLCTHTANSVHSLYR